MVTKGMFFILTLTIRCWTPVTARLRERGVAVAFRILSTSDMRCDLVATVKGGYTQGRNMLNKPAMCARLSNRIVTYAYAQLNT